MQGTKAAQPVIKYQHDLSDEQLRSLYKKILFPRMIEEKMLVLLRQGKITKWFSGIGQEAISVGVTSALGQDEYVLPMHRNLGVFTTRDVPLERLFSQWQGKAKGFTKGRDRSFHFGTQEYNIVGMISHLGPQMGVADGIALAQKLKKSGKATAVFTGEGGTSEGDFHEAMNVASVWDLPVLFCVENNGYGLSTPVNEQYNIEDLADKGKGYGMEAHIVDGNNILEVYQKMDELAASIRKNPRPIMIEFKTFRRRGHEEASGTKYVPDELMEQWAKKDPVDNYENYLLENNILTEEKKEEIRKEIKNAINKKWKQAKKEKDVEADLETELADVYQDADFDPITPQGETEELRFIDALSEGIDESMDRFDDLVIMGQDIAEYGGVFKITQGLVEKYGRERVRNTPICESSIVSAGMGLSIAGKKAIVEMQFGDFVSTGFNPIVNYLAKVHYRWDQNADVVVRMPCGAGVQAGPFHSQTNEAWFTKTPGLKVLYPAFPGDAKGLLNSAIEDPNPVMFFEHKALYRSVRGEVPKGYYHTPLGKAAHLQKGDHISIITYGAGVHWALKFLADRPDNNVDLIDLRSLSPLDTEAVFKSVKRTGKVLLLQEDTAFGGIMAELSALISENCFEDLDGPIKRVTSLPTPVPFTASLEEQFLAKNRLEGVFEELDQY